MNIVIVGAGHAGGTAAGELREQGYAGDITLVGAETHPPYERPPLSKGILLGDADPASAYLHAPEWYAEHQVDLTTGETVERVDLDRRHVEVGGRRISYDRLLLASGAAPRRLPLLDESGLDVRYLRTLDDSLALKASLAGRILIVGAGWIGLEVAAAARLAGADVTVVESASLPLAGVLGPTIAPVFAGLHREHGVDLRLGTGVQAIDRRSDGTWVLLSDGHELAPDLVVVGIGAEPRDQLARDAGLPTDGGVLVDPRLRTDDPHVYAAGDVARHQHPVLGRRVRVEHWDTALHQGRHVARVMLGSDEPYARQPYFFTDQYDLGMEYVGQADLADEHELVVRGDLAARVFTAFWIHDGLVVAGMHVNDWDAIEPIRAWVGTRATAELRDVSQPLGVPGS